MLKTVSYALASMAMVAFLGYLLLESTRERQKPNIVIFVADDLGYDDVGAYGNSFVRTPNIDALARNGLRFDNAFLTTSSCSPSRGSILTGRYPHSNGLQHLNQGLPKHEATIARYLKAAGYYTASVGKWHIGHFPRSDFDLVYMDREKASGSTQWLPVLQNRPRNRPFFLWLASLDPHRGFNDGASDLPPPYRAEEISVPRGFVDGPDSRNELAGYYREVTRFDRYVGSTIAELKRQKVLDNTIVIVMSDNGRPFHRAKMTLYDDGIKTPFIVHWPEGIEASGTRSQLLSAVDIAPGLLELAGLPPAEAMQGVSFVPLLNSEETSIRDVVFAERNWHGRNAHERAVRNHAFLYKENQFPMHGDCLQSQYHYSRSFKALQAAYAEGLLSAEMAECFRSERPKIELFAVGPEGTEFPNLAGRPEFSETLQAMQLQLQQWRQSTGDTDYTPYQPAQ